MSSASFRTGCVYWPRRRGPFFLARESLFDPEEIEDELAHLADIGFDFARIALPWEQAQPAPARVQPATRDRLDALLDAAQGAGIGVQLKLAGRLGDTLFLPRWLLASEPGTPRLAASLRVISEGWESLLLPGNLYSDRARLDAQRYFWREIAHNFASHPALAEIDPGAGGLLTALPPRDGEEALFWWEQMDEAIQEDGGEARLTYHDSASLLFLATAPPLDSFIASVGRLALAASPVGSAVARGSADEAWPLFLLALARALAGSKVGCGSLGVPTGPGFLEANPPAKEDEEEGQPALVSEKEQARFFDRVPPDLYAGGVPVVCHALWGDAPTDLRAAPPFDRARALRRSGLLREDGSEKEAASIWRAFLGGLRADERPQPDGRALDLDPDEWYARRAEAGYLASLYARYLDEEI